MRARNHRLDRGWRRTLPALAGKAGQHEVSDDYCDDEKEELAHAAMAAGLRRGTRRGAIIPARGEETVGHGRLPALSDLRPYRVLHRLGQAFPTPPGARIFPGRSTRRARPAMRNIVHTSRKRVNMIFLNRWGHFPATEMQR